MQHTQRPQQTHLGQVNLAHLWCIFSLTMVFANIFGIFEFNLKFFDVWMQYISFGTKISSFNIIACWLHEKCPFDIGQQHHEEFPLTFRNLRLFCPLCTSILGVPLDA